MKAKVRFEIEHPYDEDGYGYVSEEAVREIDLSPEDMERLLTFSPDFLREHMRKNIVGRCSTECGTPSYYCECLSLADDKLILSLQANYYLWRNREEKREREHVYRDIYKRVPADHKASVTMDEFNEAVPNGETFIDVAIGVRGVRVFCGQMTLAQVSRFCSDLALELDAKAW